MLRHVFVLPGRASILTSIIALFSANLLMAEAGGPLKPYEIRILAGMAMDALAGREPVMPSEPAYFPPRVRPPIVAEARAQPPVVIAPPELLGGPEFANVLSGRSVRRTMARIAPIEICATPCATPLEKLPLELEVSELAQPSQLIDVGI